MKVNYVKTIGFRKFKKTFETELFDVTNVTGKNRSGKSNVLYAIINIMLGTNLSGDEKSCLINKSCDASYGELHFTDNNGIKHILIRGRHRYKNSENFVSLDGKNITQKDLLSFYKDKKLFLSILNPLYFLNKKTSEQKEMVDNYLSDIKPKEIFDMQKKDIQDSLLLKLKCHKDYDQLSSDEQCDFINQNLPNIFMDIAYSNLSKTEQNILEGMPHNIPLFITELNADIKRLESVISNLDGKIEYAQNIVNSELPNPKEFEKDIELSLARQELSFLNTNQAIVDKEKQKQLIQDLEKDLLSKESEYQELQKYLKAGKIKYLAIKKGESSCCPTCLQHIKNESKNITIENMKKELISHYDKSNLLETQLKDLKLKLSIEKCKYHSLESNTNIEKDKRIAVIEENIRILENEKLEIEKFNNEILLKTRTIENARTDIENFNKEKQSHQKCISNLNKAKKVAQKLYISYIEEKMKLAKKYLKDVDIKFYSVLKTTGEIKEDFIITYKNTPLCDLSRSETIATSLEFANMFNKISRAHFPIFIDDYESCADYNFIKEYSKDTQLIVSQVEKGHPLKIADYNSNNYTIIKPVITGFKTIPTYKNNITNIPNAA